MVEETEILRRESEHMDSFTLQPDDGNFDTLEGISDEDTSSSGSSLLSEESIILNSTPDQAQDHHDELNQEEEEATEIDPDHSTEEDSSKDNINQKGIKCLYTNADSLLGKRDLLKQRIDELNPDIIAVTESLPKNMSRSILNTDVEYALTGYNMFQGHHNKSGVLIYTANHLQVSKEDSLSEEDHEEQIWCSIKTKNDKRILLGNVYHSPSSTADNHKRLRDMIVNSTKQDTDNIIIVGDFNMPGIDWESWNRKSEPEVQFIETLQDQFMHQSVDEPTRYRFGQVPSLLDLIISSKEELVKDLTYLEPIGKSDHLCLYFNIYINPEFTTTDQERYRMDKGDFVRLGHLIDTVDWEEDTKEMDTEQTWLYFKEHYDKAVEVCIPKYTAKQSKWRRPLDEWKGNQDK